MSDEVVLMKVFETDTKPTADEAQAGIMRIHFGQNDIASCGCVTAGPGRDYENTFWTE